MFVNENGVKIEIGERKFILPLIVDENNKQSIDIRNLRKDTGLLTYDPGFGNTASCQSSICTVDGENGVLKYRGYDIEDLVENCDFVEVAHLLVKGELPNVDQRLNYMNLLNRHSMLHSDMKDFFRAYPKDAHPMAVLAAMVASLSAFYPEIEDVDPEENIDLTVTRLLSKMRTIAAYSYRKEQGMDFVSPSYKYSYCANLLNMMFSSPVVEYEPDPICVSALNKLLIMHADHEQNCSTTGVRLVASSEANLYAAVTAGISALWGSKHGGANQAVMDLLTNMVKNKISPQDMVNKAKDKNNNYRLPGFGHRIYKTYDPRAKLAKKLCYDVIGSSQSNALLDTALELESIVLKDDYFLQRNLYPNVDFYTGITYHQMGIPTNMFTVMFAVGRIPGWIAHYLEWTHDPYQMLARPRQVYTGPTHKTVVPLQNR